VGYHINWDGPTAWKFNIENDTGAYVCANDYGVYGPFSVPSMVSKVSTVTATTKTLESTDSVLLVDATGGNRQLYLCLANTSGVGRSFGVRIRRIDASGNTVTITASGSDTLNGAASETLAANQGKTYVSNGVSAWYSF
jgi:hypothetical protein